MISQTKIVVVTTQIQFQFCGMNLNVLKCNMWETLLDSTNLLREMSEMSSKNKIIIGSLTHGD